MTPLRVALILIAICCVAAWQVTVIPESLMNLEVGHAGLSELHVVQTMHQRKQLMAERSQQAIRLAQQNGTPLAPAKLTGDAAPKLPKIVMPAAMEAAVQGPRAEEVEDADVEGMMEGARSRHATTK